MNRLHRLIRSAKPDAVNDPVFALRGALVFVAAFAFTRGWRYTADAEPVPMAIQLISGNLGENGPMAWGAAWFVACAAAIIGIPRAWPAASLPVVVLSLVFAYGFTLSWIGSFGSLPGTPGRADYANASNYWTVIGLLTFGYVLSRGALKGTPSTGGE